jgi:NAD-dependent SIR2 family protein deacetylase
MSQEYVRTKDIYQRVRCMKCGEKLPLEKEQMEVHCPGCGMDWVISWINPDIPMVLRPSIATYKPDGGHIS